MFADVVTGLLCGVILFGGGVVFGLLLSRHARPRRALELKGFRTEGDGMAAPAISIVMQSDKRVVVTLAPQNPDGTPATVPVTWESDNASVSVDAPAPGYTATIGTPSDAGAAIVRASAPGFDTQVFEVSYTPAAAGSLNPTVGTPESDLS